MRPIKFNNVIKYLERYQTQKDARITQLVHENMELKKRIAFLERSKKTTKSEFTRAFRKDKEMASVFYRWNRIKEIVKKRKSALDINEYLELKPLINFDE